MSEDETPRELTREQLAVLYCINTLNSFQEAGIVTGRPYEINPAVLPQLEAFEPTTEEMSNAMEVLAADGAFG